MSKKTLRKRPIELKHFMSKDEMINKLFQKYNEWINEGFDKDEVFNAIYSKVRPLMYGFYWHRYPRSQDVIKVAFKDFCNRLGISYPEKQIKAKFKKPRNVKRNGAQKNANYLEQFNV